MGYTLEEFAETCHKLLKAEPGFAGIDKVRAELEKVLVDQDFVATYLGPSNNDPRRILYEDPELGFCICAHVYKGAKEAPPHDHGHSWAIYGQAIGVTEMSEYEKLAAPHDGEPGKVKRVKTYTMTPGMAVAYDVGVLHSPKREDDTRLIRIEGTDISKISRDRFEEAA